MRTTCLAALGLAALVLAGGCGSPDPGTPAADPPAAPASVDPLGVEPSAAEPTEATEAPVAELPDACGLVSKAEAEKLASAKLNDAVPVRDTCTYTGPVSGPTAQVEVYVGDGVKKYLDIERELKHEIRPLPGLGDEAHLTGDSFFIRKADVWVAVRLTRLVDPAENRRPLETLARTVAGRL
ncbi:hypothetical protein K7640_27900 [Micromonospora sp. PLK6-60]|uniref:hypothetical protein n=1 Tax=Micromonospora sp. PLK6-60 TaxID=2873383 RepID=UPI001CA5F666|nr:hypothetical protein [Micromonospora sp. PLK6-60]MBY8875659.1 hypothetical protein [Micromonospora sp. PLK6-60]